MPYSCHTHWTGPLLYELCWKLDLNGRGDWVTLLWHWDDSWKHQKIMEAVAEKIDWLKRNVWICSQLLELEAGKETDFKLTFWYSSWFYISLCETFHVHSHWVIISVLQLLFVASTPSHRFSSFLPLYYYCCHCNANWTFNCEDFF